MRADRLVATLLLMQSRGRVTAAELATELEISVATARRDLEALSAAGVPVYPQPGRGGGWSLVGGARTDLSGLSAIEAQALFLLLGPAASSAPEVRGALRKLVRALPDTFRAGAEAAVDAVVVDPSRWGGHSRQRPDLVRLLQDAVVARRKVELSYANRAGERSRTLVDPWGLIDKDEIWYLLAGKDSGDSGDSRESENSAELRSRTYRVDRIERATVTELPAHRPPAFELRREWDRVVDEVEARRSTVTATLLIQARFVPILRSQHGRQCTELGPATGGRERVRIAAPTAWMIAQQLAGWGAQIELEPDAGDESPAVRAELARIGGELVAGNAG